MRSHQRLPLLLPQISPQNRPNHQGANPGVILERYQENFRAASEADVRLTTAFFLFAKEMNPFLQKEQSLKALSGEIPLSDVFQRT